MMGGLAPWHWIIIAVLLLIVFGGGGKLSALMGDAAKGIRAFRDGMKDEPENNNKPEPTVLSAPASSDTAPTKREDAKN